MRNIFLGFLLVIVLNMVTTWCFMGGYIGKSLTYLLYLLSFFILFYIGWRFYLLLKKLDNM